VSVDARYVVTVERAQIPVEQVVDYLATTVSWGRWRTREQILTALRNSWRIAAVIDPTEQQVVSFGRAISDGVGLAYLADVYTVEEYRGQGLVGLLLDALIEQGPGRDFRWMLHTDSAHGLYARLGFEGPDDTYMERRHPRSA
jgi:predicted GNAT family acetyltransferase